MSKKFIRRVYINKRTGQLSVTIPKKRLKFKEPSIKFGENLFVELKIIHDAPNKKTRRKTKK